MSLQSEFGSELLATCNGEISDMEDVLKMISPSTSIILTNELALMGSWENTPESLKKEENIWNPTHVLLAGQTKTPRGDYFQAIDKDGTMLFDEYIEETGILVSNTGETDGYIFILKDTPANSPLDAYFSEMFGDGIYTKGVIIYHNSTLYCNNIKDESIKSKYEYSPTLILENTAYNQYGLTFNSKRYSSYIIDRNNNIHRFNEINLRL